jgi:predicted DNA-binding transcriptional regulator AlpA
MDAEILTKKHSASPRSIADIVEGFGRLLTAKELAPLLGESPKTLYARVKRGAQPAVLLGGAVKFDPYVTAEWLRSQAA